MGTPRLNNPEPDRTLVSWKEIAAWLGHAERTVKRWERERGLPVHRVPGGKRGGVFAYTSELQAWLLNEQNQELIQAADGPEESSGRGNACCTRGCGRCRTTSESANTP
jgi:phage terminase Nu1 subunit (DNA packaging protein)